MSEISRQHSFSLSDTLLHDVEESMDEKYAIVEWWWGQTTYIGADNALIMTIQSMQFFSVNMLHIIIIISSHWQKKRQDGVDETIMTEQLSEL